MCQDARQLHRRRLQRLTAAPLPFRKRQCCQELGWSLAELSDQAFPESLWNAFGEHVGENEHDEE